MELNDIFYVVVFLSAIGGTACVFLIFVDRATRVSILFPAYLSGILFLSFPIVIHDAALFYHEPMRAETFTVAARIWIIGFGVSVLFMFMRTIMAHRIVSGYSHCATKRVLSAYGDCIGKVKFKQRAPLLLYGTIKEPACVITTWRSFIVLDEEIIGELSDDDLRAVLTHELLHIKRKHALLQRVFDIVCCVHWFNPIVWISRHGFLSACETDCDRAVLSVFGGRLQAVDYAKTMVRLMELASIRRKRLHGALGALGYRAAKHRITNLIHAPSKLKKIVAAFACVAVICGMVYMSTNWSRSYFYPFSGSNSNTEWSGSDAGGVAEWDGACQNEEH